MPSYSVGLKVKILSKLQVNDLPYSVKISEVPNHIRGEFKVASCLGH